jgi:hypothetical protein
VELQLCFGGSAIGEEEAEEEEEEEELWCGGVVPALLLV